MVQVGKFIMSVPDSGHTFLRSSIAAGPNIICVCVVHSVFCLLDLLTDMVVAFCSTAMVVVNMAV
jgi:hypothetical protein